MRLPNERAHYEAEVAGFFNQLPPSAFEEVACLFCGPNTKTVKLFRKGALRVVRCKCGFVFSSQQPTQSTLDAFYSKSQAMNKWAEIKQRDSEKTRQDEKYATVVDFIATTPAIKSVLDIGCGTGHFLSMVRARDPTKKLVGIDQHVPSLSVVRRAKIMAHERNLIDTDVGDKFDCVTLWGVLEHAKDPKALLELAAKHLNPQSYLVVCVPNVASTVVETLWEHAFTFCPQHLWYFSARSLRSLLSAFTPCFDYSIEPEADAICRRQMGFKPYGKIPSWVTEQYVAPLTENLSQTILSLKRGYKIVQVVRMK